MVVGLRLRLRSPFRQRDKRLTVTTLVSKQEARCSNFDKNGLEPQVSTVEHRPAAPALARRSASARRHGHSHVWDRADDVSTEDLRLALRRYRSFFSRLLSL
jgi:hypothetical protein